MSRGRRSNRTHGRRTQNDGLRDALTGIGGEKDVLATGMMGFANYVTSNYSMLSRMYRSNIWVKKAVSIPAQYAVKGWRKIEDEDFEKLEKKIGLKKQTAEALKWSNLFGGSIAVFIVDDGLSPDKPLNLNNIKDFKRIIVTDRWKTSFDTVQKDPMADNYGDPDMVRVNINGRTITFHHSRVHRFISDTLPYDEQVREHYWGISKIEIIYRQLIADDVFLSSVANMMKKATVDIVGIPGLSTMVRNGQEDLIKERVRIAMSSMSNLNAWVKDAGQNGQNVETYDRITQQFAGFDSMDEKSMARLAGAAEIPATIFLNKSPDGMNATGVSDLTIFSDSLSVTRELQIDPFLEKADTIMAAVLNKEIAPYTWVNPFPKSEKDEADIRVQNMSVIDKMALLEVPNDIISQRMADWNIIDQDDVDKAKVGMAIEPFEIEGEEFEGEEQQVATEEESIDPSSSLNGAQVTAMLDVISRVRSGELAKGTAIKIFSSAFPLSEAQANTLLGEVEVNTIEEEENADNKQ